MALNKSFVNVVFAVVVVLLGLTAGISFYIDANRQDSGQASGDRIPDNRPPDDVADRVAALERLIAANPQNPEYRTQLANLYYDVGQYEKAVGYYQQSLSIRPQDPNVETDLATCFHYLGHDEKALETLDRILNYSPGFSQAMFNKGIILIAKKDEKGAIAIWEDLLRSNPNFPQRAELEQRINQLRASVR